MTVPEALIFLLELFNDLKLLLVQVLDKLHATLFPLFEILDVLIQLANLIF